MTKRDLAEYRKLNNEIVMLKKRINTLKKKDIPVVRGKVQASKDTFPFLKYHMSVEMDEPVMNDTVKKLLRVYNERLGMCSKRLLELEEFINNIDNSELRQIFEMRFIEGMKQEKIADSLHIERSSVSKKITSYLKVSHNSQNKVL